MFESVIQEQEGMLASENLAGNVVKAEFHKGCLFALRLVEAVYHEARQGTGSAGQQSAAEVELRNLEALPTKPDTIISAQKTCKKCYWVDVHYPRFSACGICKRKCEDKWEPRRDTKKEREDKT